jgi:uncharacterized protein
MDLFTPHYKKNLTRLLTHAANKEDALTLTALHGFLFGLAITPEPVVPSEWLPAVFGEEMLELEDEKEGERLMGSLFSAYNKIVQSNNDKTLVFPFEIPNLKAKELPLIREWAQGLFRAISLRPSFWNMDEAVEATGYKLDDDAVEMATCTAVVTGVAFPNIIPELFQRTLKKNSLLDKEPVAIEVRLFVLLPKAVASMQAYGHAIKNGLTVPKPRRQLRPVEPLKVVKVGRNDPCPCGSGSKYKKCCGK